MDGKIEITDISSIQEISLNILKKFVQICTENNIQYYLAYGSLIGAIRHKGFIPWDDDLDVFMPRKEYERFVKIIDNQRQERYQLMSVENNSRYHSPYPKFIDTDTVLIQKYGFKDDIEMGIYIDIFLIDGCSNDFENAKVHAKKAAKQFKFWVNASQTLLIPNQNRVKSVMKWVKNTPNRLRGSQYYLEKLEKICKKYFFESSKYCAALDSGSPTIWRAEDFGMGKLVQFETVECLVPEKAEKVLAADYGNYMKLPDKQHRQPHHEFKAFWK